MGRVATTILPAETSTVREGVSMGGVTGPLGGQFGQQWDEQQYGSIPAAYQYGNPDILPEVSIASESVCIWCCTLAGFSIAHLP